MFRLKNYCFAVVLILIFFTAACASKKQHPAALTRVLSPPAIDRAGQPTKAQPAAIILGNFHNRSSFSHRSSSGNYDRLGVQARSIAKAHLNKLGRFMVLDRNDQRSLIAKVRSSGEALSSFRPRYILNGNITAFGSQVPAGNSPYSYRPMFARLGKSKNKDVHAQITINIMDAKTAELVHSTRGAGVYKPSRGRIPYYSGAEGYNVAANGKALGLAIKDALNKLNKDIDAGKLSF